MNTPMISEQKKWKIEDKITKLTAERDVLDWKRTRNAAPTVENYETQMRYYNDLWQQNQDAILGGLRKDTVKQGSDEWYTLLKKRRRRSGAQKRIQQGYDGIAGRAEGADGWRNERASGLFLYLMFMQR